MRKDTNERKLNALRLKFSDGLSGRLSEVDSQFNMLQSSQNKKSSTSALAELAGCTHQLSGTAGSFSFWNIHNAARKIELNCTELLGLKASPSSLEIQELEELILNLKAEAKHDLTISAEIQLIDQHLTEVTHIGDPEKPIILVEDDPDHAEAMKVKLMNFGFFVECVNDPELVNNLTTKFDPIAIIMDIMIGSDLDAGLRYVQKVKKEGVLDCPFIFVTARNDIEARINAVSSGADGYLVKPVNIVDLVETIDRLTEEKDQQEYDRPIQIMIIDDEVDENSDYLQHLCGQNIICRIVPDYRQVMTVLEEYQPEVIIIGSQEDTYTGQEIAASIRQINDDFARIPVIFISDNKKEMEKSLRVRSHGDDLFERPVDPDLLLSSILARAHRLRALRKIIKQRRTSEQRFQAVSEMVSDAIIATDEHGYLIYWNRGAAHMFGWSSSEILGTSVSKIIPSISVLDGSIEGTWVSKNNDIFDHPIELIGLTKNDEKITIELSVAEWMGKNRNYFGAIVRDISERKRIEKALEQNRKELADRTKILETILSSIDEGFAVWDKDHRLVAWSHQCLSYWYDPPQSVLSERSPMINLLKHLARKGVFGEGDIDQIAEREKLRIIAEGTKYEEEITLLDGRKAHFRRFPLPDGGRVTKYTDVTNLRVAESELRTARDDAEAASVAKSNFLATMSHELRTPLTSSIGSLGLLNSMLTGDFPEEKKELVEIALRNNQSLLRLVNELLDFEKTLSGILDVETSRHDISSLTSNAVKNALGYARTRMVNFVYNRNSAPLYADINEHHFEQVLNNLLSNAAKFSSSGSDIEISVEKNREFVFVRVKDFGVGIPDGFKGKIFEQFTQVDSSSSRNHPGTGLGLSISKALTEAMGGTLEFDSEVNVGTTFVITFPASE